MSRLVRFLPFQNPVQHLQNTVLYQTLARQFKSLPTRDRRALQLLLIFLSAALFYLGCWQPLNEWSNRAKQDFQHQRQVHQWVQVNIEPAKALTQQTAIRNDSRALPSRVTQAAREAGLTLSRVQPNDKGVSVWLEQVPYEQLLPWLDTLETRQQIRIEQVRIDRMPQDGVIKAFIQLGS